MVDMCRRIYRQIRLMIKSILIYDWRDKDNVWEEEATWNATSTRILFQTVHMLPYFDECLSSTPWFCAGRMLLEVVDCIFLQTLIKLTSTNPHSTNSAFVSFQAIHCTVTISIKIESHVYKKHFWQQEHLQIWFMWLQVLVRLERHLSDLLIK